MLVINRRALACNYKLECYDQSRGEFAAPHHRAEWREMLGTSLAYPIAQHKFEFEERVNRKINNAVRYIDGVYFPDPQEWAVFRDALRRVCGGQYDRSVAIIESKVLTSI